MIRQTLAIALNTFLESVRQPIFFVLILAGAMLQAFNVLLSAYSMGYTDSAEVSGDNKLLLDMGLATVFVIATLLAALIASAVVSREIENKTAMTVISKPVGRALFIVGKYIGSTASILLATVVLFLFLLIAIRHEVMSTATDKMSLPVVLFGGGAFALSIGVGMWGNFFYGWVFSSTASFLLLPLTFVAYLVTLGLEDDWQWVALSEHWTPQIILAGACLIMAIPVLTAVALAASTRLGQVLTLFIAAGVLVLGLLSNHFFGRHAFQNDPLAAVETASAEDDRDGDFRDGGDVWRITLKAPPERPLEPGMSIYYGPAPNGVGQAVPVHASFEGDPTDPRDVDRPDVAPALVVRRVVTAENNTFEYELVNAGDIAVERPPEEGDHLFLRPTQVWWPARIAWSVVPNLQFFWLVDAVTQAHPIPPRYVGLVAGYSAMQILALVSLAVILFQRREVG